MAIEEHNNKLTREVEATKARIFPQQGKPDNIVFRDITARIDNDYVVIGAHIDEVTQLKILRGEYVDFSKLIPRDKVMNEGESKT